MSWIQDTGRIYCDFATEDVSDFTVLGATGAAVTKLANGYKLTNASSADVRLHLTQCPGIRDGTFILDVTLSTAGTTGMCFRTKSLYNVTNSYGLFFGVTATNWYLFYSQDSNYSSQSTISSGTGTYTGRHTLKVVISGTTLTCYIDNVQVYTTTSLAYYTSNYGFVQPRVYGGDGTVILHSLELQAANILDDTVRNINRFVKVKFDREVHFPYTDLKPHANAFTATFPWRDYAQSALTTKTITAIDMQYAVDANGVQDKTTLIVKFDYHYNFRSCLGDLTLHYDNSKCTIYGRYTKDVLPSFSLTFTPTGLDGKKDPSTLDVIQMVSNCGVTIVPTPIRYVYFTKASLDSIYVQGAMAATITPTLTGTINP